MDTWIGYFDNRRVRQTFSKTWGGFFWKGGFLTTKRVNPSKTGSKKIDWKTFFY